MSLKLRVRRTGGENLVDYAEIVKDLEGAGLDALAARPLKRLGRGLDQTKRDPTARQIQRESQPCWSSPDNQHRPFVHRTIRIMVQCTNVK